MPLIQINKQISQMFVLAGSTVDKNNPVLMARRNTTWTIPPYFGKKNPEIGA